MNKAELREQIDAMTEEEVREVKLVYPLTGPTRVLLSAVEAGIAGLENGDTVTSLNFAVRLPSGGKPTSD